MKIFIDDERFPPSGDFIVLRSSDQAIEFVKNHGWPSFMSLDHDLGGEDTVMVFLKRLYNEVWDGKTPLPDYKIHSANPQGALNIQSYLESWKKSI